MSERTADKLEEARDSLDSYRKEHRFLNDLITKAGIPIADDDPEFGKCTIALRSRLKLLVDKYENALKDAEMIRKTLKQVADERSELVYVAEFYADPMTYFAIGFLPDPPSGDFMEDFGDVVRNDGVGVVVPGKRARKILDWK
jgi:hypothetical protein